MRQLYTSAYLAAAVLFLLVCARFTAVAQQPAQPYSDEIGSIYLGNSQVLAGLRPRLLTKNAHVSEFVCSPVGTRVAYTIETPVADGMEETVAVADCDSGESRVYYSAQSPSNDELDRLFGWSDDGAYFAFSTFGLAAEPFASGVHPFIITLHIVDLVHGSVSAVSLPIDQMMPPSDPNGAAPQLRGVSLWSNAIWTPWERLLALSPCTEWAGGSVSGICLVDPDRQTCRLLFTQSDLIFLQGWLDPTHLVYRSGKDRLVYDIAAGKSSPAPAGVEHAGLRTGNEVETAVSLQNRESLTVSETVSPQTNQGQPVGTTASLLLTRTGGPQKLFQMQLDSFLPDSTDPNNPGSDSGAQFLPSGGFDRQGVFYVVYISEGDLKIVEIRPRGATPGEKLAAGEKLSCEEEIPIAEEDAKQIGLGILMYAQDNNLSFPAGDGFHDSVYPYIKSEEVFTSPNGVGFQYLAPADPKLADMDEPADTPLGEFSLTCADVVLYGDGHVKVQQKDTAGQ